MVQNMEEEIFIRLKNSNPNAWEFGNYIESPGGIESLIEDSLEAALEKLLFSNEYLYLIENEEVVNGGLKQHFKTDIKEAKLFGSAKLNDFGANILTKNSPWTPFVSLSLWKLEQKGILRSLLSTAASTNNRKSAETESIPFQKLSLAFVLLSFFITVSIIVLNFEYLYYLK